MAHALKRISYSTCEPDNHQFAFLARNPKGPVGLQYCHVFCTEERFQAEELNAVLGKAFKVAYATLTTKKEFFELVDGLNKEEQEFYEKVQERMRKKNETKPEDLLKEQALLAPDAVRGFGRESDNIQIKKPKKSKFSKTPDNSSVFINLPDNVQLLSWGNDSEVSLFPNLQSTSSDNLTDPQFTQSLPTNQDRESQESANQQSHSLPSYPEEVSPTAPPVEPCDFQQEMVSRQTNRVRPLPPAPYYEVDVKNEWSLYGAVSSKDALSVNPESMNSGCHILLQNEQSPRNLGETDLRDKRSIKRGGKILLQDASAPPLFAYGESSDEMDDHEYLSGEQNIAFTLDDEQEVERDEDYEELMRVARAFLHGSPSRVNRRSRDVYRDMLERECSLDDTLRYSRSDSPSFENGKLSYGSEPKCQRASKEQRSPKREHSAALKCQIDISSRSSDDSDSDNKSVGNLIGRFQNKSDKNGNFKTALKPERQSDKSNVKDFKSLPKPIPRRKAPPPPRPPKNNALSTMNLSNNVKTEKVKESSNERSSGRIKPIPAPRTKFLKSDSMSSSSSTTSSATTSSTMSGNGVHDNQAVRSPKPANRKAVRAPGHIGHKVEVEVGKYRDEKKTAVVPPRPPRIHPPSNISNKFAGELAKAPWFRTGIPKEIAVDILSQENIGAFMVRESKSHPGCFALSIRVQTTFNKSGLANYLIVKTKNGGYTIKGFGKDFEDLPRLIHHYSIHQDQLPCLLVLARTNPGFDSADDDGKTEDPEYMSLTDFRSLAEE
ncbi:uncharacterized protein [Antedon mediterranea]|uniref:uncharacterized protein n=1 Tax=Antedon mediterranea TaxID=105859 RepID=UPI003AF82A39